LLFDTVVVRWYRFWCVLLLLPMLLLLVTCSNATNGAMVSCSVVVIKTRWYVAGCLLTVVLLFVRTSSVVVVVAFCWYPLVVGRLDDVWAWYSMLLFVVVAVGWHVELGVRFGILTIRWCCPVLVIHVIFCCCYHLLTFHLLFWFIHSIRCCYSLVLWDVTLLWWCYSLIVECCCYPWVMVLLLLRWYSVVCWYILLLIAVLFWWCYLYCPIHLFIPVIIPLRRCHLEAICWKFDTDIPRFVVHSVHSDPICSLIHSMILTFFDYCCSCWSIRYSCSVVPITFLLLYILIVLLPFLLSTFIWFLIVTFRYSMPCLVGLRFLLLVPVCVMIPLYSRSVIWYYLSCDIDSRYYWYCCCWWPFVIRCGTFFDCWWYIVVPVIWCPLFVYVIYYRYCWYCDTDDVHCCCCCYALLLYCWWWWWCAHIQCVWLCYYQYSYVVYWLVCAIIIIVIDIVW
jgi:hypothetical protein